MERCKKTVYSGPQMLMEHQCKRKAVRDGYCNVHHPDEVRKRANHRDMVSEAKKKYLKGFYHRY